MPAAPDAHLIHPVTEKFARDLYHITPREQWPEGMKREDVWEKEPHEVHEAFRDRARRFMDGDMSVAPWVLG